MIDFQNKDFLEYLKTIPDKHINFICIDPPYNKINGMKLSGQKHTINWDCEIDWNKTFTEFNRIIKDGGTICVFGQNPTYSKMILSNIKEFKYELIWEKNNAAQGFHKDKMPLIFTENIAVFIHNEKKNSKRTFKNIASNLIIDKNEHFTRWYAQKILNFINLPRRKIYEKIGNRKLEFFLCFTGKHFGICSEALYDKLTNLFNLKKMDDYINYEELKNKWIGEKDKEKNIKLDSYLYTQTLTNILKIDKENKYYHPTQKPLELISKLVLMYSKENDNVLDCFAGSGTCAIACLQLKRNFYGSELNKEYFQIANERIKDYL